MVVAIASGAALRAIATTARTEEVKKDFEGRNFIQTLGKFTLNKASKNLTQQSEIEIRVRKERILGQTLDNPPRTPPLPRGESSEKQEGIISITGVEVNPTESGVEVILQTPQAEQLQIGDRSEGNNFIAEIEGAQLQLPDSKPFRSQKPVAGISEIVITNLDDKTIQVIVVGETAPPQVELFDSDARLIFGLTPSASSAQTPPSSLPPLQGGMRGVKSFQSREYNSIPPKRE
ncbi:AMIN domain-containing protein [Candidatus Gracilibacteria bacterium]|nr:AMIN domain-containing protein [Candidatus Gracilibacteria bacterium]